MRHGTDFVSFLLLPGGLLLFFFFGGLGSALPILSGPGVS